MNDSTRSSSDSRPISDTPHGFGARRSVVPRDVSEPSHFRPANQRRLEKENDNIIMVK